MLAYTERGVGIVFGCYVVSHKFSGVRENYKYQDLGC